MKILNSFLLFSINVQNGSKIPQNSQSRGRLNKVLSLVISTVISIHSYKISGEYFKFFETLRNLPCKKFHKVRSGTAPSRGADAVKRFLW